MPRIRSVHPGFWTDERVVSVSIAARLLFIGLWNQCDDQGVFEWKPHALRMRLFPADSDLPIADLLAELTSAGLVRYYSVTGREFGAVRNFGLFQHPRKPTRLFPVLDMIRDFCRTRDNGAKPVPKRFRTSAEGVLREEEKEKEESPSPLTSSSADGANGLQSGGGVPDSSGSHAAEPNGGAPQFPPASGQGVLDAVNRRPVRAAHLTPEQLLQAGFRKLP